MDISEDQSFSSPYRSSRYSTIGAEEDEVRRFDAEFQPITKQKLGSLSSYLAQKRDGQFDSEKFVKRLENLAEVLKNVGEGQALERQLGINDQPVGPKEIAVLINFLKRAEPKE
ncbi:MAG TPA: hypothetical protein VH144_00210 [Candidatus Saccharimonadales bacterium]|nr:hypothetical protein [Candidatus Saccharimonadales bacterium]